MVCKRISPYFLLLFIYLMKVAAGLMETPVIGILSQETYSVRDYLNEGYDSFIAASYVKFVESAGGRVIPIWIGQNDTYYKTVVNKTNGSSTK
ncbi:gamma-glutamyl hydrolase-like [Agrilus planipennis]|uniref:folate gamma-glutamyl hydrolase n=1 Tax=Agrilus planipennis TaxID=224129 RepID=A0A1W4WFT4_AGRPL|nr:gamma-glutamyl hydrolase-like [Agrilus planipennis]